MILRPGLFAGVRVFAEGLVGARMAELSADVNRAGREADVLVWDGAATFASASGVDAVRAVLDGAGAYFSGCRFDLGRVSPLSA